MKAKLKTKKIEKQARRNQRKSEDQPIVNNGDPIIKNLTDFVTAITPAYCSKPIYTGGRILTGNNKLYASCNNQINIFDLKTKEFVGKIKHPNEQIANFAVCPSQKVLTTFTNGGLLRVVALEQQKILHIVRLKQAFAYDIAFSPDGKHLAVGFANSSIKIFTVETMRETHSYRNHQMSVKKLQWHPNQQLLQIASVDEEKNLVVFDYVLNKVVAHASNAGKSFTFTSKGTNIITACNQEIHVYEYRTLKLQYKVNVGEYIQHIHFCSTETLVFGGDETGLMSLALNDETHRINCHPQATQSCVAKILGFEGGRKLIVVSNEQNLHILDAKSLESEEVVIGFNDQVIDVKYSKGEASDYMVLVSNSTCAKVINRLTHRLQCLLQGHSEIILCCEYFHPYIATAGKDKTIKLWYLDEICRPSLIANYKGHSGDVCGLVVVPQAHLLASIGQDRTIKIWTLYEQRGDKIQIKSAISTVIAHDKPINAVRANLKGNLLVTCSHDRTAKVWDQTLRTVLELTGHKRGVNDAAFHDVEQLIVTAGGDGMLKGWSLTSGECLWSMGEGFGLIRCQFLYHSQVVTGSIDGILKIWDIRKMTSLSYDKHEGRIWALDVLRSSGQKSQIATGAQDSVYIIWRDSTEEVRDGIMRAGQQEEQQKILCRQFLHDHKFVEAAKVAFEGNYTQLFINILGQITCDFDEQTVVTFDQLGGMVEQDDEPSPKVSQEQFSELVSYICEKDINRVFLLLLSMNSTVKNFKAANKLLFQILRQKKFRQLLQADKLFGLPERKQQIGQSKQSDFMVFLSSMQRYSQKHQRRLQKYIRGTYYIDHLSENQNPFLI